MPAQSPGTQPPQGAWTPASADPYTKLIHIPRLVAQNDVIEAGIVGLADGDEAVHEVREVDRGHLWSDAGWKPVVEDIGVDRLPGRRPGVGAQQDKELAVAALSLARSRSTTSGSTADRTYAGSWVYPRAYMTAVSTAASVPREQANSCS